MEALAAPLATGIVVITVLVVMAVVTMVTTVVLVALVVLVVMDVALAPVVLVDPIHGHLPPTLPFHVFRFSQELPLSKPLACQPIRSRLLNCLRPVRQKCPRDSHR